MNWNECVIALVGGDRREQEIARCAAATGAEVRAFGFPWPEGGIAGVTHAATHQAAIAGADFLLLPIPGIAPDGAIFAPACPTRIILDRETLATMRKPGHIILGWADERLRGHAEALGISISEYEWDRDLMLLRGPAIVEGLLGAIIANTDFTIHRANVCLVGQGTIGTLITQTLIGLGARVHVVARNPVQRAAAYAGGAEPHEFDALPALFPQMDIIVSSVPARVIGEELIGLLPPHALLVDVSAPPGGIDGEAARALGRNYVWARGLGGRAPVTVGRSQWSGIRPRIEALSAGAVQ
jgi:dipicolinate synthase subunit A